MKSVFLFTGLAALLVTACAGGPKSPDAASPANPSAAASAIPGPGTALDPKVGWDGSAPAPSAAAHQHGEVPAGTIYTCPMHPEIRKDKPGKCPICGMNLVPVAKETAPHAH